MHIIQYYSKPQISLTKMTYTIYFAGGCFWGTQHFFKQIQGVLDTEVGYANSIIPNPTYKEVCTGATGAAETVRVDFDPEQIDIATLVEMYFHTIDPLSVNRQGGDTGTQYRTGIYYTDPALLPAIEQAYQDRQAKYSAPFAVELRPLQNFYSAEQYHQHYLTNNPGGYCHVSPELFQMARQYKKR